MSSEIRTIIVRKILELIPSHTKPVDYLSDMLDISKESAYRRLKGKMPFQLEELIRLSELLGFSIDELVALKRDNSKVVVDLIVSKDAKQGFLEKMKQYKKDVDNRLSDKSSSSVLALNYLPAEFCIHHENLFKLSYYTWLHWKDGNMRKLKYSEVEVFPELEELRKEVVLKTKGLQNNTFILDPNVFLSPLNLVRYFCNRELINNEEKKFIQEEYLNLIDLIEREVRTDSLLVERGNYFYLSNLNIDTNSGYYVYNGNIFSSFAHYFFNRIVISKPEICEAHKEWFLSLKKYSILITGSNEMVQAEYFKKQRGYVDSL